MKENIETSVKRFIRVPDVLNRVGFSRTTLYERIKEGNFPDRVKIGPRCVAFVESEIDEWIEVTIRTHARTLHKKETRSRVEQISVRTGHLITLNNNGEKYEDRTYYDKRVY